MMFYPSRRKVLSLMMVTTNLGSISYNDKHCWHGRSVCICQKWKEIGQPAYN
jgi:hypothetical protein